MDADGKMDVMIKKIWEHAETAQLLFFNCKTHTRFQTSICFSSLYNLRQAFNFKTTKIQTAWSHFVSSYLKKDKTSVTPSGHISHFLSGLKQTSNGMETENSCIDTKNKTKL